MYQETSLVSLQTTCTLCQVSIDQEESESNQSNIWYADNTLATPNPWAMHHNPYKASKYNLACHQTHDVNMEDPQPRYNEESLDNDRIMDYHQHDPVYHYTTSLQCAPKLIHVIVK